MGFCSRGDVVGGQNLRFELIEGPQARSRGLRGYLLTSGIRQSSNGDGACGRLPFFRGVAAWVVFSLSLTASVFALGGHTKSSPETRIVREASRTSHKNNVVVDAEGRPDCLHPPIPSNVFCTIPWRHLTFRINPGFAAKPWIWRVFSLSQPAPSRTFFHQRLTAGTAR